jgi:hypothetical protein
LYRAGGHTVSDLEELFGVNAQPCPGEFSAPRLARRPLTAAGDRREDGSVIRLPIDLLVRVPLKVAEAVGLSRTSPEVATASVSLDEVSD